MTKQPHANFCGSKTRGGNPCKNRAMANGRCRMHGGKSTGAPKKNDNAKSHGLFSKYLPQETLEIVQDMDDIKPIDILWMNIKMQFASIMRAQQIMFVEDKDDMSKEVKKKESVAGESMDVEKEEYEIQFAWDKQANFLNSQSRAMGELRSMLKQFYDLADYDDQRRLEAEKMTATIEKTKKETEFIDERKKLIQGEKKDTSLLNELINVVKDDEQDD
ncbi:phage terminase small subunit [Alkalibacillus almallahensis]|uniref:phage terminase small subunit n=1 Tax=Alkalibacillus almallahensis TaxID=1379154 RepID=UPI00141E8AA2|nr:phage terminase small subunit [Alkalibacillus almallahensis]NIK12861.1 uncharacterized protein YjcR [Alkalibacillus almallahensis]